MDRARGAFAAARRTFNACGAFSAGGAFNACGALEHVGRADVRRTTCPQPSWPCWAVDLGMEM
jgi:hypothetical protein